jgi:hypothetical protein
MTRKKKTISALLSDKPKEIAPGITTEKLSSYFFDATKLKNQPEPMYRLDLSGHRYYYRIENDEPIFYQSVTTFLKIGMPTSQYFVDWKVAKGKEESEAIAEESSKYGTFFHGECASLLMQGTYNLDGMDKKLNDYLLQNKITQTRPWLDDLKKDVLAFGQFMIDYDVKPLAVEIILWHPDGYAGAIDLVCEMTFFKRRIIAIVDMKSGKKGFYPSHEAQLHTYKEMWAIHFPDTPIDKVFNFSPKDWRKSPTYNLKNQTESIEAPCVPHYLFIAKTHDRQTENKITVINGKIDLLKGLSDNVQELTLTELIKRNK